MRRLERRLPLRPGEGPHLHVKGARRIGHVADAASSGSDVVACGKHAYDPWELGGGVGVDRQDAGMRMGRSDERRKGLVIEGDVVGEAPAPGDKPQVLK